MQMKSLLNVKKNGRELNNEEISFWVEGLTGGSIPDYQSSAMLMAIYFRGMSITERARLTLAMRDSGESMNYSDTGRYIVDKHSTGGIGDKTSLFLAPLMAASGAAVPMVSGRGLGFTGGTLDKLEAIPGYNITLDFQEMRQAIEQHGCFIAGQTGNIAPADKKLYALRDVTETVDEISLITASILSKKLTEDLNGLVLDIKCGSGAFMQSLEEAEELSTSLRETALRAGVDCNTLITRMNFPLGRWVGNLCETGEVFDMLSKGSHYLKKAETITLDENNLPLLPGGIEAPEDNLLLVTMALSLRMMQLSEKLPAAAALKKIINLWSSGQLSERFEKMVAYQQGDLKPFSEKWRALKERFNSSSEDLLIYRSPLNGYFTDVDGAALGNLMVDAGAGRQRAEDSINHDISLQMLKAEGEKLSEGDPVLAVYTDGDSSRHEEFTTRLHDIITISEDKKPVSPYFFDL